MVKAFSFVIGLAGFVGITVAQTPSPSLVQGTPSVIANNSPFNVSDLALEMAESTYKLKSTPKAYSDLVSALENYLNQNCLVDVTRTLKYDGNPQNPSCVAKMEKLLELNPNNPVGICTKEGIDSDNCKIAFSQQNIEIYDGSQDKGKELISTLLKSGIPANDLTTLNQLDVQVRTLNENLSQESKLEVKTQIKNDLTKTYEKMLGIGCRISVIYFSPTDLPAKPVSIDSRIDEVREKLNKIPANMRADYQKQMLQKYEEDFALAKGNSQEQKVILEIIKIIQNPVEADDVSRLSYKRTRFILGECDQLSRNIAEKDPTLPYPICGRVGWQTPECVQAWRKYQSIKKPVTTKKEGEKVDPGLSTF